MLKKRLIGAVAVLTPIVLLMWQDAHSSRAAIWLLPLVLLAGLAGTDEVVKLMQASSLSVNRLPVIGGSLLLLIAASADVFYPFPPDCPIGTWGQIAAAIVAATWVMILVEMQSFREPGGVVQRIALELFSTVYVTLPICFLLRLRLLYSNRLGLWAVVSVIFVVKVADSGAYFAGKSIGKHKMAPILSPKKTWEGACGAVVSAIIAAVVFLVWFNPNTNESPSIGLFSAAAYGASLAIAGMIGDLGESLIKRDVRQKDSASWLPGLGGVLDMLDSLLLAAPVGYLFWAGGLLG